MKVRVILCSHNGARFIEEQLASIMEQSRMVDIVHLFDFASTDGTRALLEQLTARWPKLDVRLVENAPGVTLSFFHAFTTILAECGDQDVIFLSDQDDVWLPIKVETVLSHLAAERAQGHDLILAFHDVRICDATLRPLRESFYQSRPFTMPRDLDRKRLLIANPVIGHTVALTKPILKMAVHCLRPAHYVMHDWAIVLLAAHAGRIVQVPGQLGLYRQHDANILGVGRRRSIVSAFTRAIRLSRSIGTQTSAFVEDAQCFVGDLGGGKSLPVLPGRGPVALRLSLTMIKNGHTFGHRLMAFLQICDFLLGRSRIPRRRNRSITA